MVSVRFFVRRFIDLIASNKEVTLVLMNPILLGVLGNNGCGIFLLSIINIKRK
jgi:ABC-type Na+ transport system ATPase subunit NatA